ncbi:preprotein translocase subunit TatB [Rhodobacterales bacterium 59_46_T64]|nr:preprotein translocase subunit TatB [Rhodobacterales bacterium 59_46_T64]
MNDVTDIDARGLMCPLPVLRARKALLGMPVGAVLRITADDPVAVIDLPHFCAEAGHDMIEMTQIDGGAWIYVIRRR